MNLHSPFGRRPLQQRGWVMLAVLGLAALTPLILGLDDVLMMALAVAGVGLVVVLLRPELATLVVVFLLYTNIPVVASQLHGVPRFVAGAFMLLLGVPLVHHVVARREGMRWDLAVLLLVLYGCVLCVGFLVAEDAQIAVGRISVFAMEGLLLYWLLLNSIRTLSTLRRVIFTCTAAGALLGSLSLFQAGTGNYNQQFSGLAQRQLKYVFKEDRGIPSDRGPRHYRSDRAEGPFGEPNRYAQVMLVLLPLTWVSVRRARRPRLRLLAIGMTGAILGGMLLSYSRGGFVGLVAMSITAAGLGWIRPRALVAASLAFIIGVPIFAPTIATRLLSVGEAATALSEGVSAQQVDGSIRGRLTETLAAAKVFFDHPIIGVGPGQYAPFYSEQYHKDPSIKFRDILKPRRAHNLYSELAAEGGLAGVIIFFSIAGVLARRLWVARGRWVRVESEYADLATALLLSMVGYFTTAMFLHLSYERYYWFLLALAGTTAYLLNAEWHRRRGHAPHTVEAVPFDAVSVDGVVGRW